MSTVKVTKRIEKREVKKVVEEAVRTYTITLDEEQAELLLLLLGSLSSQTKDSRGRTQFDLDLDPEQSTYPARKLACKAEDLRSKMANRVWTDLNDARNIAIEDDKVSTT